MTGLRVVHVVCTDAFAGVERYVLNSALNLQAAGCEVTVIGGAEGSMREPLGKAGIGWRPGRTTVEAIRSLRRIDRPQLINTHMTSADLAGAVIGGIRGVPVVSTRHFASTRGSHAASRLIARGIARRIAAQIAISGFVSENVEGDNTVVYTGIDAVDVITEPREPIVLVVQRLEAEKKTEVALQAWARIADHTEWRLVIAGEGSEGDALHALAETLGIASTVDFIGFQTDVDALMRRASIFFAPTPREGLGIAVIEAMAHGLPVVASGGGGHLESVGAVDGAALFAPGNAAEAARQLVRLIGDGAERERYGSALRERQQAVFNPDEQTAGTLRAFAAVVPGRESNDHA